MNLDQLQQKLIAAARTHASAAQVPYAFEQRILAHLKSRPRLDMWALWSGALWRAAAPCIAIMLVLCAWTVFTPAANSPAGDLSQDLENTVLAEANLDQAADTVW